MPKQILAFEQGGEPRIELEWGGYMRHFTVSLDGEQIGRIDGGQRELKQGRDFPLPDGSTLTIRLHQSMLLDELQVMRNGAPLPGSAAHPRQKVTAAVRSAFFGGIAFALLGVVWLVWDSADFLLAYTTSTYSIVFGLLLTLLATRIAQLSRNATIVAVLVFLIDWLIAAIYAFNTGFSFNFFSTIGVIVRIFALVPLIQVLSAIRSLQAG